MSRYIDSIFCTVYRLYNKWGDVDPYYSAGFTLSVLVASFFNFIISIIYFFTQWEILSFELFPVGVLLIVILISVMFYFYSKKEYFAKLIETKHKLKAKYEIISLLCLFFLFLTWFAAPFFYKWGYTI